MAYVPDWRDEQHRPCYSPPTISVIERPSESYDDYHKRKKKEERDGKPKRVPFGFARVLEEEA